MAYYKTVLLKVGDEEPIFKNKRNFQDLLALATSLLPSFLKSQL